LAVAVAVGAALTGSTVIVTVSVDERPLSSKTLSSKTSTLISLFATIVDVNYGVTEYVEDKLTVSPDTWLHMYDSFCSSGSLLLLPSNEILTFSFTI